MILKTCGITNFEDAKLITELFPKIPSVELILGFILADSPRKVTIEKIKEIIKPPLPKTAFALVFADENIEQVKQISAALKPDYIQLHGSESTEYCQNLRNIAPSGTLIIKAISINDQNSLTALTAYQPYVDLFLLDTFDHNLKGGTGKTFNWALYTKAQELTSKPILLSGGLCPQNITKALSLKPAGLDLSSGLEATKGKKDPQKVMELFELLRDELA